MAKRYTDNLSIKMESLPSDSEVVINDNKEKKNGDKSNKKKHSNEKKDGKETKKKVESSYLYFRSTRKNPQEPLK
jgi:hypothetical protein